MSDQASPQARSTPYASSLPYSEIYNYPVVKQFTLMTLVWGIVGMLVGVIIAAQLVRTELNLGLAYTHFGRLRPLHTNAVVFAFGGCALMSTSFYVVQRTCQARLISDKLAGMQVLWLVLWLV